MIIRFYSHGKNSIIKYETTLLICTPSTKGIFISFHSIEILFLYSEGDIVYEICFECTIYKETLHNVLFVGNDSTSLLHRSVYMYIVYYVP